MGSGRWRSARGRSRRQARRSSSWSRRSGRSGRPCFGGDLIPRPSQPVEVVDLAVLLASDEASFITGANFVVDGGMSVI
ncbi:SDR family oxidoreductase [Frankia sp. Mgl5]|uniref:SDR family oxidoreductase n=1 Tax=Frankia sp. Mgl5 TaxID=2933793 RepID=UPI0034D5255C